jgi:hypothetical protein
MRITFPVTIFRVSLLGVLGNCSLSPISPISEAKRREVRELKETLDQIHKDLTRKEREPAPDSPAPALSGESDPATRQLREKVKRLESDLKERHNERNALQRRLERIQTRVDSLNERAQPPESAGDSAADAEERLLLPQEAEENHPLRLIEFPRNFLERLNEFPHHVARGSMVVVWQEEIRPHSAAPNF